MWGFLDVLTIIQYRNRFLPKHANLFYTYLLVTAKNVTQVCHLFAIHGNKAETDAKSLKATIIFVMSVCPYVLLPAWMEEFGSHWTDFLEILCLNIFFPKSDEKIQVLLKFDKNNRHFTSRSCTFMTISKWIIHRMRNVLDKSVENIKIHMSFLT
jgi:hypothetical protein